MKQYRAEQARMVQGEVVVAAVGRPNLRPDSNETPKQRPVVLLRPAGRDWWTVMGLTTLPTYGDGTPRIPITDPYAAGLSGPGYLWGRPTDIPADQITNHIGWCHDSLITAIADLADLDEGTTTRMTLACNAERARSRTTTN